MTPPKKEPAMERLPVYRLDRPLTSAGDLVAVAAQVFDITDEFAITEGPGRLSLRRRDHVVEQYSASGGIWAADQERWFNPSATPDLPTHDPAVSIAQNMGRTKGLLPDLAGDFGYGEPHVAGTHLAILDAGERTERQLDVQVVFPVRVGDLPVVGGGGDFTLALGDGGQLIGYTGVWRNASDAFDAAVVPQEQADAAYREMFAAAKGLELRSVSSYLAYYAAPTFTEQDFLYPVYVYLGTARIGDEEVPLRAVTLPATDFGPKLEFPPPVPTRLKRAQPTERPASEKHKRRAYGIPASAPRAPLALVATKPWEAGTSWIGMSGGLAGSQANAKGFVDEWAADGWIIDFNWGDAAAFESDWRRNDDMWVDNADFVFYTGHANQNGWVLSNPDDGFLSFSEVGSSPEAPGDLWGSSDLEWAVIAACGPLQDELLAKGGGDVLDRWDGAFDGMHQLLGYGAITFDNTEEGRRIASYCRSGMTIKDAWFRAAKEIQPSTNGASAPDGPTVWVGTMWAGRSGVDPIDDHAWSHGSVSADPTSPTLMACMWTVC
jgi:uncharacterized protein DUF6345